MGVQGPVEDDSWVSYAPGSPKTAAMGIDMPCPEAFAPGQSSGRHGRRPRCSTYRSASKVVAGRLPSTPGHLGRDEKWWGRVNLVSWGRPFYNVTGSEGEAFCIKGPKDVCRVARSLSLMIVQCRRL